MAGRSGRTPEQAYKRLVGRFQTALLARRAVGSARQSAQWQKAKSGRMLASAVLMSDGKEATDEAKKQSGRQARRELEAWSAYDTIGEVTTLVDGTAGLVSQCRFYPGVQVRDGDDIVDVPIEDAVSQVQGIEAGAAKTAVEAWKRFGDESGSQAEVTRSIAQNWSVVGRTKLVGYMTDTSGKPVPVPENEDDVPPGFTEVWQAVAPTSLRCDRPADDHWILELAEGRSVDLDKPIVYELVWSHPRRPRDAMGWVMSALDVCRDLQTFTMAQRSAGRSGIPADLLIAPLEASPKKPQQITLEEFNEGDEQLEVDDEGAVTDANDFALELEEMLGEFLLDVVNDANAGTSVIPGVLTVTAEMIEKFRTISFSRQVDRGLGELVRDARTRLSEMADCPPEMLTGLGSTNRWNGGQIAEQEYRRYFKPKCDAIASMLTAGPFRHWMSAAQLEQLISVYGVRILVDPGEAVAQPDYSKIAMGLLDRAVVGPAGVRKLLRIPDSYAPSVAELAAMVEWKAAGKPQQQDNAGRGDQGPPSSDGEPDESKGHVVVHGHVRVPQLALAAAGDDLASRLTGIEVSARTALAEACEAALDRAIDRAGARLRGWARKDPTLKAELTRKVPDSDPGALVIAVLGPARCAQLAADNDNDPDTMWKVALAALVLAFRRIAADAFGAALAAIGKDLPQAEIDAAITRAEAVLIDGMKEQADQAVFGTGVPGEPVGEQTALRVPTSLLRRVLAVAGGALGVGAALDPTPEAALGLVFGPLLQRIEPEWADLEWVYGTGHRQINFPPHEELSGQRFSGPTDDKLAGSVFSAYPFWFPGDHKGCQCLWKPVFASDDE